MCRFLFCFLSLCSSLFFFSSSYLYSAESSSNKIKVLYTSLDPRSISQHLAFYELYSETEIGKQALKDAWNLMSYQSKNLQGHLSSSPLSPSVLNSLVFLVNKPIDQSPPALKEEELLLVEEFSKHLSHHRLKGHSCTSEEEIIRLPPNEVDLARGVFLSQSGSDLLKTRSYEAVIDLMALQILARLDRKATPEAKIRAINRFIFEEMGFRFPPHSLYAKDIDVYTFLPSVLDSHRGVCLGVSILYLCLAQRLDLQLEMITPPGHIYVRYRDPQSNQVINIETTARGIHLDSEKYLNVDTRALQQRNIKEVIGLAHVNQAAVFWQKENYQKALESYEKAEPYLPDDSLVKELKGYTYLFTGNQVKGEQLLQEIKDDILDYAVSKGTIPNDYLEGKMDAESIKVAYKSVDEDRASILAKKKLLEDVIKKYPQFRAGVFHLAVTWLQLHRLGEALEVLKYYHTLYPDDPESNYYLAVLYMNRMDYNQAWNHLRQTETITRSRAYEPKVLKDLRKELSQVCPE